MIDFVHYNPTKIYFGKNTHFDVGEKIRKYSEKILLIYGKESFKKSKAYDEVIKNLNKNNISFIELQGVESNPKVDLVYKGIDLCKQFCINFILAVGGGSVIDTAKAISVGVFSENDILSFFNKDEKPKINIPVGTILTLPGSGSESSNSSVITFPNKKLSLTSDLLYPVFSILNPELTLDLPISLTMSGIVDALCHVFERYFTRTAFVTPTEFICKGLIREMMRRSYLLLEDPTNYDLRAEFMYMCKITHDNTCGNGRKQDWACHTISHEIASIYNVSHGDLTGIIFLAWMIYLEEELHNFRSEITPWDWKLYLTKMGKPTDLQTLLDAEDSSFINQVAKNCSKINLSNTIGNFVRLNESDIKNILNIAWKKK